MSCVLVIGDTHCPGMLEDYPEFLWNTYKQWRCDRVVHIGDLVDWHAINFHGKHSGTPGVMEEVQMALDQTQVLYRMFPECDWLTGNHDALPARRAEEAGLPSGILRGSEDFWEVPKWKCHPRYHKLEIDKVLYSHGETGGGGQTPAWLQSKKNFQSTVIGHYHQAAGVWWSANTNHLIFGMNVGCGLDWKLLQFEYGVKFPNKPIIGCGVVIDGMYPYFEPMRL